MSHEGMYNFESYTSVKVAVCSFLSVYKQKQMFHLLLILSCSGTDFPFPRKVDYSGQHFLEFCDHGIVCMYVLPTKWPLL